MQGIPGETAAKLDPDAAPVKGQSFRPSAFPRDETSQPSITCAPVVIGSARLTLVTPEAGIGSDQTLAV